MDKFKKQKRRTKRKGRKERERKKKIGSGRNEITREKGRERGE